MGISLTNMNSFMPKEKRKNEASKMKPKDFLCIKSSLQLVSTSMSASIHFHAVALLLAPLSVEDGDEKERINQSRMNCLPTSLEFK